MLLFQSRSKPAWQQTAPSFQLSPNKRLAADTDEESHTLGQFKLMEHFKVALNTSDLPMNYVEKKNIQ